MNGGGLESKMALVSKMCWLTDSQALTPECVHTPFADTAVWTQSSQDDNQEATAYLL